jgi:hypothetical protein
MHRQFPPVSPSGDDSSDDISSSKSERKDIGIDIKSVRSSNNCRILTSAKSYEGSLDPAAVFSLVNDEKLTETTILWNSLSSSLVNLAKVQCFNSFL